ncbi:MAG: hydroxyacylglutathione hydrolase [Xanthomonadales bacterium]|nr:hydroxyacylglutathione hydrolase [Xanthomonadales bacterium]
MQLHAVPILDDNYVWLLVAGGNAVAIDPGEADPVIARLRELDANLSHILVTHHHGDHIGGIEALRRAFPEVRVLGPVDARIPGIDLAVADGDVVELPLIGARFRVVHVPGHTLSHVAYAGQGMLFCGDTLFSAGCGRLFEGTPAQMLASLDRLSSLPDDTRVCCAHEYTLANLAFAQAVEPDNADIRQRIARVAALRSRGHPSLPSALGDERRVNPFLRVDQPAARRTLEAVRGVPPDADRTRAFAALRQWKDVFRG